MDQTFPTPLTSHKGLVKALFGVLRINRAGLGLIVLLVHAGRVIFGLMEPAKVEPQVNIMELLTCFIHKMAALMELQTFHLCN